MRKHILALAIFGMGLLGSVPVEATDPIADYVEIGNFDPGAVVWPLDENEFKPRLVNTGHIYGKIPVLGEDPDTESVELGTVTYLIDKDAPEEIVEILIHAALAARGLVPVGGEFLCGGFC